MTRSLFRLTLLLRTAHMTGRPAIGQCAHYRGGMSHRSDVIRSWAGYVIRADKRLSFKERRIRLKPLANDRSINAREAAWDAWRPAFAECVAENVPAIKEWVYDRCANVRRCAVEGSRPRGVWTKSIPERRNDPDIARAILEPLTADPSRYVQKAVANWLNDASKDSPDWFAAFVSDLERRESGAATSYIIRRATRHFKRTGYESF